MDLTKIKIDGQGRVRLHWTDKEGGKHQAEYSILQTPHPDFIDAFNNLRPVVEEAVPGVVKEVRGVSFSYDEERGECATITALYELHWTETPFVVNTPHAPTEELPHPLSLRALEALQREARLFYKGKRAQGSLFEVEEDEEGEEEAPDRTVLRAVRDLAPKEGSGIDRVTISTKNRSVTLTPETRKRAEGMLREV